MESGESEGTYSTVGWAREGKEKLVGKGVSRSGDMEGRGPDEIGDPFPDSPIDSGTISGNGIMVLRRA